jgi:hypothetical protein
MVKQMEKKKIEWEKPKLVEIGKSKVITYGTGCATGPTFGGNCTPGGNASNGCSTGAYYFS